MKMRRLLSCIMALLLAVSLPVSALSDDWYLENGDITVNAPAEGEQTVTQGSNGPVADSAPVITQRDSSTSTNTVTIEADAGATANVTLKDVNISITDPNDGSGKAAVTIEAGADATANVTLDGVNIDTSSAGKAAITIEGDGNVTIELDGENTVQSGDNHAGVEKNDSDSTGNLTITDENGTDGSLTATGGEYAAGIGGGYENSSSNITISGGEVTADGGEGGSGIGGGAYGQGSNITISGGTVDASGGTDAAGIGGGERANGSDITISGGTVTAIGGNAPSYGNADSAEVGEGGGSGIGGGAYGTSDNITVENDAVVTAAGKGNAADIGDGNSEGSTVKQTNKVDLSGLSSFGKVNGVSGSNGSNLGEGSSSGSIGGGSGSTGGSTGGNPGGGSGGNSGGVGIYSDDDDTIWGNILDGIVVAAGAKGITASDIDGNDLSSAIRLKEDSMEVSVKEDNVLVSGNKADLLQLTVEGVKQINLETNRVNVSVSSEVLNKITSTGGSFQLTAADTTVSLTTTDQNNKKTLDMTLSANKLSDTQAAPGQSSKQPVTVSIDSQSTTGNNSAGSTLEVTTNASDATLSYSEKCAQTLLNSEFRNLALAVGNVIATTDSQLAANTTVNGSGSITIGDTTVNMNGFKFSAGDSSENDKLADMVNNITFTTENQSQGGSAMVVEVNAKASMQAASLEVPGSALQSLMDQGVEETALSVNGKTTSFKNSNLLQQIDGSQMGSTTGKINMVFANDEIKTWAD